MPTFVPLLEVRGAYFRGFLAEGAPPSAGGSAGGAAGGLTSASLHASDKSCVQLSTQGNGFTRTPRFSASSKRMHLRTKPARVSSAFKSRHKAWSKMTDAHIIPPLLKVSSCEPRL